MATLKEYREASDNAIFTHKENKFGQPKAILRLKLNQIAAAQVQVITQQGGDPRSTEATMYIEDLLKEVLEHFEISEPEIVDDKPPYQKKSKDGKGEFCHGCGLQKEDTRICEIAEKIMRLCEVCRMDKGIE